MYEVKNLMKYKKMPLYEWAEEQNVGQVFQT